MVNECVYEKIIGAADSCSYVLEHCHSQQVIKFTHIYFCEAQQNILLLLLCGSIFLFLAFHFLSCTADNHLAPGLTYISIYLKMSQTLSGVTLIAFANGAPDVLTAFVASGSEEGILMAVGSVFGSLLFITTFVLGSVIFASGRIKVNRNSINRDLIFNMIGTLTIITFAFIGRITYWMAALFFSLYFVYIGVVLLNEKQAEREKQAEEEKKRKAREEIRKSIHNFKELMKDKENNDEQADENQPFIQKKYESAIVLGHNEKEQAADEDDEQAPQKKEEKEQVKSFKEMTVSEKAFYIYQFPFEMLRRLTIPPCNEGQWNKTYSIIHCVLTPVAFLMLTNNITTVVFGVPLILIIWGITFFIGLYVVFLTEKAQAPRTLIIFVFFGIVLSVLFTKLCVEMIIDFLLLIQTLTGVSFAYLGMTFLALGNSLGDYLVNMQVAKLGYGLMALTGCFAGAVFNLLMGFGSALIRQTWINKWQGTISFNLFKDQGDVPTEQSQYDRYMDIRMNNSIAYTLLLFQVINLLMTFVIVRIKNYRLTKPVGNYYFTFYGIFFLVITLISFALDAVIKTLRPQ